MNPIIVINLLIIFYTTVTDIGLSNSLQRYTHYIIPTRIQFIFLQ